MHPETGRKNLFVNPQFTVGLKGFDGPNPGFFFALPLRPPHPRFVGGSDPQPGTLGFWDNRTTMHYGVYAHSEARRTLNRGPPEGGGARLARFGFVSLTREKKPGHVKPFSSRPDGSPPNRASIRSRARSRRPRRTASRVSCFPSATSSARSKLDDFVARTGRRPNVLVILMDDVGWGDFGCYGGGVAVGAPTPNIDRLAREGLLLTSCYSEPSCTPTRASIMTGRLPMRHGLLIPPMYGMPGGLQGEITLPQMLSDAGYVTQAVGKWHMGENRESQPQHVGFDDFYGFLSVSDMYTEWRDPYFFPEIVYSEARTEWVKNIPFNKCFVHASAAASSKTSRRSPSPCCRCSTTSGASYSEAFIESMAGADRPWFLYHCTRGAHFDNYPHPDFLGRSPAKHPYKDALIELDDICGRLVEALERTGQLDSTMVVISSDNGPEMETWPDSAFTPFRCAKGSTWEGGVRVPAVVSWPGMIEPAARATASCTCSTCSRRARRWPEPPTGCRPTATSTPSTRRRSCWRRPTRARSSRTASSSTTG